MIDVVVFVVLTVTVAAPLCGHQGQPWPLRGAWRGVSGPLWARGRLGALRFARRRVRPPQGRVRPSTARVSRPDTGTTSPSRPRARRCGASQSGRGAFHAPTTPGPPQRRTGISTTKEAA